MKTRIFKTLSITLLLCFAYANTTLAALTAEEKQAIAQVKAYNTAFKAIAREVTPSVVTINVTQEVDENELGRQRRNPFFQFRDPSNEPPERQSTGSGIIMTTDGYILTNHHVAGDADKLTVTFSDNQEYDAEL
ncbi:MAG: hypothetical protein QGG64_10915, partial [Candidatus Latescibacteria bacterium]|nr:hypothetical protein [Candidatus Latescibacterota bacterium]